ncbi:MAG: hypothetical protein ACWGP1_17780, partial [Syntrophobacteria bacterium]
FDIINCTQKSEIRNPKSKIEAEAYLNSTSQGEPVLSLPKEGPRTLGRAFISTVGVANSWIIRARNNGGKGSLVAFCFYMFQLRCSYWHDVCM